jgi:ribonuclease R
MGEVEGIVEGHRDGHGFVVREDGEPSIYLAQQEMRSVLHRDRVRVRVMRYDRKGRPEGRVLDILERRKAPIIGRLLHEAGQWVVAPEDRRYGQDILIPKNATASARPGRWSVELTEPPSLHSQPVGRVLEVLGEIDDPGMEIEIAVRKYEVPHRFSPETLAQAAALPDDCGRRPQAPRRPHRRGAGHHRRRGRTRLRRRRLLRALQARPRQDGIRAAGGWWWPSPTSATT